MHVPLSLALGRFKRLPQRSAEVWQGGLVKLPSWVEDPEDPDATPTRPVAAIWVSLRTGLMHVGLPKEAGQASPQLALEALLEFGLKKAKQLEGRPARLEVRDAAVRDALAEAVADLNTTVVVVDDMPYVSEVLGSFEESEHGDRRPGALEAAGVTLARLRAFADAAALFYEARPWIQIPGDELLVVESPGAPRGMAHLAVLGAGGEQFGVGFFESRREFERIFERPDPRRIRRAHGITFGPITEMPFGDVDAWEDHGLPVAGPLAYPVAADLYADGRMERPDSRELAYIEAVLRALAETTEDQLDSGRWNCEVETADGRVHLAFSLPLLLEAEARRGRLASKETRQRGLFDEGAELAAKGVLTPIEQAQELAGQAMEAEGRYQIKLARQALALSADCADASVVLGHAAGRLDVSIEHYERAVAAGARAIEAARIAELAGGSSQHLETGSYMRARFALAQALRVAGRDDEAFEHYRELLRLDPDDHHGARYLLLGALLEDGRDEEAGRLLERYADDVQASWPYGRVLWRLRTEGDAPATRAALDEALRVNAHVAEYLVKPDSMPLDLPSHFELGSEDEAAWVADQLFDAFEATPGALPWLHLHASPRSVRRRTSGETKKRKRT